MLALCSCAGQVASVVPSPQPVIPLDGITQGMCSILPPRGSQQDCTSVSHSGSGLDNLSFAAAFLPHFPSSHPFLFQQLHPSKV